MGANQPEHSRRLRAERACAIKRLSSVFQELLLCLDKALAEKAPVAFRINQKHSCFVNPREDVLAKVVLDGRVVVRKVKDVVAGVVVELVHFWLCGAEWEFLDYSKSTIFKYNFKKKEILTSLKFRTNYIV